MVRKKICFVASSGFGLVRFRLPLISLLIKNDFDVVCLTSEINESEFAQLKKVGAHVKHIDIKRGSLRPYQNLKFV